MSRFEELFNAKRPDALTSELPNVQTSKSKDPAYKRTTVYLPADVHRKLKVKAAEQEREMSEIISKLVVNWLDQDSDND
ncbi:MAG: CopG family transcriptional regulator [Snowella sp.]|nr:CopG family transcriptional regulator [Snowella sp.]